MVREMLFQNLIKHSIRGGNWGVLFAYFEKSCLHTNCTLHSQAGKAMKKVFGASPKKKYRYNEQPNLPTAQDFTKGAFEGKRSVNSRRANVLNKLFMRSITDIMATGECSSEILGHGIEINRVKVTPDYKILRVYWIARNTQNDDEIDKILQKSAGYLRHELSQLRVVGVVPTIKFIKDLRYAQFVEIDNRLSKADFGEDHVPLEITEKLKTQLELFTPLNDEAKKQIEMLSDEKNVVEIEEQLPPMSHSVLGLNHAYILNKIVKVMKKSEAVHRLSRSEDDKCSIPHSENESPIEYSDNKSQRLAFKEFLFKRQLMKSQVRKEMKNYIPDVELIKEELEERHSKYFENMDIYDKNISEDDYVIEDEDNKRDM